MELSVVTQNDGYRNGCMKGQFYRSNSLGTAPMHRVDRRKSALSLDVAATQHRTTQHNTTQHPTTQHTPHNNVTTKALGNAVEVRMVMVMQSVVTCNGGYRNGCMSVQS